MTRLPSIYHYLHSISSLVQRSQDPESETRLSVLPCVRTARRWCDHIEADALVDLSARNVAVFQVLEVDENLVWAREIGAGRTGQETGRAGEADAKVSELGASAGWGEGKASGERAGGDGGGVSLSVAECAVGSNKHLLAAGNDDVWTELASRGGERRLFWVEAEPLGLWRELTHRGSTGVCQISKNGNHRVCSRGIARSRGQRAVRRGVFADPEILASGINGLQVNWRGRVGGDQANGTGAGNWSRSSGSEKRESGGEERGGELHSDLSFSKFFENEYAKVDRSSSELGDV
ncbi:hypothetical protein MMC29_008201 [Sticta canariensis]|nr:hypothetical protein [Sticta canariensis]